MNYHDMIELRIYESYMNFIKVVEIAAKSENFTDWAKIQPIMKELVKQEKKIVGTALKNKKEFCKREQND